MDILEKIYYFLVGDEFTNDDAVGAIILISIIFFVGAFFVLYDKIPFFGRKKKATFKDSKDSVYRRMIKKRAEARKYAPIRRYSQKEESQRCKYCGTKNSEPICPTCGGKD